MAVGRHGGYHCGHTLRWAIGAYLHQAIGSKCRIDIGFAESDAPTVATQWLWRFKNNIGCAAVRKPQRPVVHLRLATDNVDDAVVQSHKQVALGNALLQGFSVHATSQSHS
ncbi:MAG: hypothetical protein IJ761_03265 [Bacteroidales bacterium]|nr:hypothetical protein [Bacteroidales bacterium]